MVADYGWSDNTGYIIAATGSASYTTNWGSLTTGTYLPGNIASVAEPAPAKRVHDALAWLDERVEEICEIGEMALA